jgi:predicted component of type VI protein secretion system
MAGLTLHREDGVFKRYPLGSMVTIGRLPDNTVVIDNPAVSSHHACVFRDGEAFVVEDLQSTNGTFVNSTRVVRETLHHGDVVLVGQHRLVFDERVVGEMTSREGEPAVSSRSETLYLNGQENPRLLAVVLNAEARSNTASGATAPTGKLGVLRVVAGRADQSEYVLTDHTSLIGRADWTLIRLRSALAPRVAVAITRNQLGYVATRLHGTLRVNSRSMNGRHDLKEGDLLDVGELTLVFSVKE